MTASLLSESFRGVFNEIQHAFGELSTKVSLLSYYLSCSPKGIQLCSPSASQPSATLPCTTISTEAKLTDKSVRENPGFALQFQQTVEVRGKLEFHQLDMKYSGDHNQDDDAYTQ